jgi:hypothetical protein
VKYLPPRFGVPVDLAVVIPEKVMPWCLNFMKGVD